MRKYTRSEFLGLSAGVTGSVLAPPALRQLEVDQSAPHRAPSGFAPWLEIDADALAHTFTATGEGP